MTLLNISNQTKENIMKKILQVTLITAILSPLATTVEAKENMSLRICEYVQANDKQRLRKFLKLKKVKLRTIYDSLKCNGDNILIFSAKSNALDIGDFIIGKLPAKKVAPEIEKLAAHSAHLSATAKKRSK